MENGYYLTEDLLGCVAEYFLDPWAEPGYLSEATIPKKRTSWKIVSPVAFCPHLTIGLAFYRKGSKLPTGSSRLLEAGNI
jgi:hypothetical protein